MESDEETEIGRLLKVSTFGGIKVEVEREDVP